MQINHIFYYLHTQKNNITSHTNLEIIVIFKQVKCYNEKVKA